MKKIILKPQITVGSLSIHVTSVPPYLTLGSYLYVVGTGVVETGVERKHPGKQRVVRLVLSEGRHQVPETAIFNKLNMGLMAICKFMDWLVRLKKVYGPKRRFMDWMTSY